MALTAGNGQDSVGSHGLADRPFETLPSASSLSLS